MEELVAAGFLVAFTDRGGTGAQAVERAEEPPVGGVLEAHVPRAPPPRLPQPVEAPVVPDPEAGVCLHRVARELTEPGPAVEEPGPIRDHGGDRVAADGAIGLRQRRLEAGECGGRLRVEHGFGETLRRQRDGLVGHDSQGYWPSVEFEGVADTLPPEPLASEPEHARPTRLVLARHAVTAQTGPLLSGRAPGIDLSDTGREQAKVLGERLAGLPVAVIYASPIERTTQTAEAVAQHHGLVVQPLPGVIEADYGEWTGGKLAELAKTDLWKTVQRAPSRARFPGGESLAEMQTRMVTTLEAVVARHPGELVVVVSHADPIKAAIAHYTGVHLDLFQRIVVSPASVTVFELSTHGAAMVKCNDTGSLDELLPPPPQSDVKSESEETVA